MRMGKPSEDIHHTFSTRTHAEMEYYGDDRVLEMS